MPTILDGYDGSVTTGTGTPVTVAYLEEFEIELDQEIVTKGPFVGNSAKAKSRGGKELKVSGKGIIVDPMDAGQKTIFVAADGGANLTMTFDCGGVVTVSAAMIVNNVKFGNKADEGIPFSFEAEAASGYTLTWPT